MSRNGSPHATQRAPRRPFVAGMMIMVIVSLFTLAALWLPQRPVRIALSALNALIIIVLVHMLTRRRR